MKQQILFHRDLELKGISFEAGTHEFYITDDWWMIFDGRRIMSLAVFANWFTDRGQATFVDSAAA